MSREHLIAAALLALIGLLWMFVNMKTRGAVIRPVSFFLMLGFLIASTLVVVAQVWQALS